MPPNRKASISDYPCISRFASLQTIVTAKDAPMSRTTVDEFYWDWPSSVASISTTDDAQEGLKKKTNNSNNKDLFSANHIVANLVREASRLQIEEEEKQVDDPEVESSCSSHSLEYWNPHPHSSELPTTARIVEDRLTSGIAIEDHLTRDSSLVLTNQQPQQQPSSSDTASTKSSSIANTTDVWWSWPTFPHTSMRFSHEHYQRQLLVLSKCTSSSLRTPIITTTHQHDDYWHGM